MTFELGDVLQSPEEDPTSAYVDLISQCRPRLLRSGGPAALVLMLKADV